MKASEMVKLLEGLIKDYGDLEVFGDYKGYPNGRIVNIVKDIFEDIDGDTDIFCCYRN